MDKEIYWNTGALTIDSTKVKVKIVGSAGTGTTYLDTSGIAEGDTAT